MRETDLSFKNPRTRFLQYNLNSMFNSRQGMKGMLDQVKIFFYINPFNLPQKLFFFLKKK